MDICCHKLFHCPQRTSAVINISILPIPDKIFNHFSAAGFPEKKPESKIDREDNMKKGCPEEHPFVYTK